MPYFVVSYDLHKDNRDYEKIHKGIEGLCSNWCKPLESFYVLETSKNFIELRDYLNQYIDNNDSLFVIETSKPAAWSATGIDEAVANYLTKNF